MSLLPLPLHPGHGLVLFDFDGQDAIVITKNSHPLAGVRLYGELPEHVAAVFNAFDGKNVVKRIVRIVQFYLSPLPARPLSL